MSALISDYLTPPGQHFVTDKFAAIRSSEHDTAFEDRLLQLNFNHTHANGRRDRLCLPSERTSLAATAKPLTGLVPSMPVCSGVTNCDLPQDAGGDFSWQSTCARRYQTQNRAFF